MNKDKYFVITEDDDYQGLSPEIQGFETRFDLERWLKNKFRDVDKFDPESITIIRGREVRVSIKEKEIVKEIRLDEC